MPYRKTALSLAAAMAMAASTPARADGPASLALGGPPVSQPQPAAISSEWWRAFNDPALDKVIESVLAQNLDLQAAVARIAQARAAASWARAEMLPSVSLSASAQRVSQSLESPVGSVGAALGQPRAFTFLQTGGQASWEIDLFGRLGKQRKVSLSELAAASSDAAAIRLSLCAEAVSAYLELRNLQASLAIAEAQVANAEKSADLIRLRVDHGFSPAQALDRAYGTRDILLAEIPALRAAIAAQSDRIDVLMGRNAGSAREELVTKQGHSPILPEPIDPGVDAVPADLMRRRPDVVAAEQRMLAADDRIAVALTEYYPRITLEGLLGFATLGISKMFTGDSVEAAGGASLRWRLFDFGRVDAEAALARGRHAEALAMFKGVMVQATADVETALTSLNEARRAVAIRERQVVTLTAAHDRISAAYHEGNVAYIDVIEAEQDILMASKQLATARARAAQASVFAVRALGGGFDQGGKTHG